ncbi:hypothetical protein C9374_003862 [Naegleria lovaniensis]|uniref:Translation initiation factor IF2/IF5 domain-containing protein n=1 Tax=Naegleria lovaniensis TaxID=51637 RepID=A0AA88GZW7_NAELO|nr:uncharacterized protein C9374_003862 [Naegleria lovaniensis]KAG2394098.1 hypothetical protein C9374_003862 [Naegleria lovaniensis]
MINSSLLVDEKALGLELKIPTQSKKERIIEEAFQKELNEIFIKASFHLKNALDAIHNRYTNYHINPLNVPESAVFHSKLEIEEEQALYSECGEDDETVTYIIDKLKRGWKPNEIKKSWSEKEPAIHQSCYIELLRICKKENRIPSKHVIQYPLIIQHRRRTVYGNFISTCEQLKRCVTHVYTYLCSSLMADIYLDSTRALIIKRACRSSLIKRKMIDYIRTFVLCPTCFGMDTRLRRDSALRMSFICCDKCGSQKQVPSLTYFHSLARNVGTMRRVQGPDVEF